jgi:hypothetical protein
MLEKIQIRKTLYGETTRPLNPNSTPRFRIVPVVIGLLGNVHKQTMDFFEQLAEYSDQSCPT